MQFCAGNIIICMDPRREKSKKSEQIIQTKQSRKESVDYQFGCLATVSKSGLGHR